MSNELGFESVAETGNTLYAHVHNAVNQIYNGSGLEAPADGNWANYDITMPEDATGKFFGDMPTAAQGCPAGAYHYTVRRQAGGSPAVGDIVLGSSLLFGWDGSVTTSIAAIKTVTDALTAAAAAKLALSAAGIVTGIAEAGTLSTTQMTTDLSEATDDHYIGAVLVWTSGVLSGQRTDITDYAGANGLLTFTSVTEAPSATDTFVIL